MADGTYTFELGFGRLAHTGDFNNHDLGTDADGSRHENVWHTRTTDGAAVDLLFNSPAPGRGIGDLIVTVIALKSDNAKAGSWHKGITVKWDAAEAATVVGASYDLATEQGASGYLVTLTGTSGHIRMELTGAASETVDWWVLYHFIALGNVA